MDENKRVKEVFAHFGLSMYHAQVLEHQLINMLAIVEIVNNRSITGEEIDNLFEGRSKQTMGRLIKDLKRTYKLNDSIIHQLGHALETRNIIAHSYFRERAHEFCTKRGQEEMIIELEGIQTELMETDEILTKIHRKYAEKYGITQQKIDKEVKRLEQKH